MSSAVIRLAVAVLGLAHAVPVLADGVLYDLRSGSYLINDCPECGRRPIQIPLEGTFVMTAGPMGVDSRSYEITRADFRASSGNADVSVTGTGKYNIVFPSFQSMALDLDIGGEPGIHFESDGSKNEQPWPFLEMSVIEKPGSATRIYTLRINAAPVGTGSVAYTLGKGSTFADDCPPCAHVIVPIPISGTFTLTKVDESSLDTIFRVDGIDFMDSAGDKGLHITGIGRYVQGGDFALTQSTLLEIDVTLGTAERAATLASPTVPVNVGLPDLDVSLDEENPASLGSVFRLHIVASPGNAPAPKFRRGDANDDVTVNISDAISALGFLFLGNPEKLACEKAADSNDDGKIDLSDAVALLNHLVLGAPAPPAPSPECGLDTTPDELPCETKSCG